MLKVEVTQEDIDLGRRGFSDSCALARALTRATGKPASVGLNLWWRSKNRAETWPLTPAMREFRRAFDSGHGEPQVFLIRSPND